MTWRYRKPTTTRKPLSYSFSVSRPTTAYPHFIKPSQNKLTANRLTVTFQNGNSIGVNTDGYVFVNGKLRAIKSGDGRNLYHDLFVLFYPTAKE